MIASGTMDLFTKRGLHDNFCLLFPDDFKNENMCGTHTETAKMAHVYL